MIRLLAFLGVISVLATTGCSHPKRPEVPFTDAHRAALIQPLIASGLGVVAEGGCKDGVVYAVVNMPYDPTASIGEKAKQAVIDMRNAVYVMPGADKSWSYKLRLMGPPPGPGLVSLIGTARFSPEGGQSWNPEGF